MRRTYETESERRAARNGCVDRARARCLAMMEGHPEHPSHGTRYGYACGCRCDRCRAAARDAQAVRRAALRDPNRAARLEARRRMARALANGADGASVRAEFRATDADMAAARAMARRWAA